MATTRLTVIAKNNSGSSVTIDTLGLVIPNTEQASLNLLFPLNQIYENDELYNLVTAGTLVINDGTSDLSVSDAQNFLSVMNQTTGLPGIRFAEQRGIIYTLDTDSTANDPSAKEMRFNQPAVADTTVLYLDEQAEIDQNDSFWLDIPIGSYIRLQSTTNSKVVWFQTNGAVQKQGGSGGWFEMPVEHERTDGSAPVNEESFEIRVLPGPVTGGAPTLFNTFAGTAPTIDNTNLERWANHDNLFTRTTNDGSTLTLPSNALTSLASGSSVRYPYFLRITHVGGTTRGITTNVLTVNAPSGQNFILNGNPVESIRMFRGDVVEFVITASGESFTAMRLSSADPRGGFVSDGTFVFNSRQILIRSDQIIGLTGYTPNAGDAFIVSAGGSIFGGAVDLDVGDVLVAKIDNPGLSTAGDWIVLRTGADFPLSITEAQWLDFTSISTVITQGADYAVAAGEIRIKLYSSQGGYSAADLNTTGQIDSYTNTSNLDDHFIAIRLTGQNASLTDTLPDLWVYVEHVDGTSTRLFNMADDFTFQGDFGGESDYLADNNYDYLAGDVLRIYETTSSSTPAIDTSYDASANIPDLSIDEEKLDQDVQNKLNSPSHGDELPDTLSALANQSSIDSITHSEYRSNAPHVFLNNTFALLKNAPTTFPNTASAFQNEITGAGITVSDPDPVTAIQDVSRVTNGVMSGAGLNNDSFSMTLDDGHNWRLNIGGWMYYDSIPSTFQPLMSVKERGSSAHREVFGMGPNGFTFKRRNTTGSTTNISTRNPLTSVNGKTLEVLTGTGVQSTSFRIYSAKTYFIQIQRRLISTQASQGGEAHNYVVTDIDVDQAATTQNFALGGTQAVKISYKAGPDQFGDTTHAIEIEVDEILGNETENLYQLDIDILDAAITVPATSGNTYTDVTMDTGHVAAGRLMRYIVSFRSTAGGGLDNLEVDYSIFGYDGNGSPRVFDENTEGLNYIALDLEWDDIILHSDGGVVQNIQGFVLNSDTPLIEYPLHSTLRRWLSSYDRKDDQWVWGNVHGPDQDTELVTFREFTTYSNFILVSANGTKYRLTVNDAGTLVTSEVT